ncbi:molybdate transporter 2-like [Miscanthus floridulus]|uniref:molybdate transporter 2-like n=1 Tax=Miscanthus floridulus TaxID=154761 RepID=UPI00345A326E
MPVQPMKSIAAVALSSAHLTVPQIMAAGLAVAAVLLVLGATGLMTCIYRLLPLPVVRGVQLSQGLSFTFTAVKYVRYVQDLSRSSSASTAAARPLLGLDGLVLTLAALLLLKVEARGRHGMDADSVTFFSSEARREQNVQY